MNNELIVGVILAAGKGKRFGSEASGINKVTAKLKGKPLIVYGVDLLESVCSDIFVVIGSFGDSVKRALVRKKVYYAYQKNPKGTGYAVLCALREIKLKKIIPSIIIIGYGDHMFCYTPNVIEKLINEIDKGFCTAITVTENDDPSTLNWGRVMINKRGYVEKIVEYKDASVNQRNIKCLNAGLYAFNYEWLQKSILKLQPSKITGEYYLTDLVEIAVKKGKKVAYIKVPFKYVGYGVNTKEDLLKNSKLF